MATPAERSPNILVADDDPEFLRFLRTVLEREGYKVLTAQEGNEALEVILHEPLDLALLDVNMPEWNGMALCRIVKSNPNTRLVPVVLITGETDPEFRMEGIEAGADEYLTKPVAMYQLLARVRSLLKLKFYTDEMEHAEAALFALALSIEARDPYTHGHCERLSAYSVAMAERLKLPEEQKVALRRAGIVHDIGKVALPDHVLLKPGPLNDEERRLMEMHPTVGERICAPLRTFQLVLPIIRHHHERIDGSGYPDGLRGEQIPLTARILTIIDMFDALSTDRPYRKALPYQHVLQLLRAGTEQGILEAALLQEFESLLVESHLAMLRPK